MTILRFFAALMGIIAAALFGNYVGDRLRARTTGEESHQFQLSHNSPDGETVINLNPNLTNFLPGILAGILFQPRLAWAFLGGVLASGLLGDKYEEKAIKMAKNKLSAFKV